MCDKCQSKQEAKIHTQYTQMPNILILHLLSYGITSSIDGNLNAQKLSNRSRLVNYFNYTSTRDTQLLSSRTMVHPKHDWMKSPIASKIKMNQSLSNKNHFKLFAVVMHSGTTLNSGHYTAFVNYKIISQACTSYSSKEKIDCIFFIIWFSVKKINEKLFRWVFVFTGEFLCQQLYESTQWMFVFYRHKKESELELY
jgi:uncharacterized UBP type Zn finger protein